MNSPTLDIEILKRENARDIDPAQWDNLAQNSRQPNLFYERWNLLSALEHVKIDDNIFVVTLHDNCKLVGLFPIRANRYRNKVKYIEMWNHPHSSLSDPLLLPDVSIEPIARQIAKKLQASWFSIPCHTKEVINDKLGVRKHGFRRAAIFSSTAAIEHKDNLPGKVKRENRRILKRLNNQFEVSHREHHDLKIGLERFCELENRGWKGRAGTSMKKDPGVYRYYETMLSRVQSNKRVTFHELWGDENLLAITMRLAGRGELYDIKTTYDEKFKSYSPGVAIELLNISLLKNETFTVLDSCTRIDNKLINKLWPHQRRLFKTLIFTTSIQSMFWYGFHISRSLLLRLKKKS